MDSTTSAIEAGLQFEPTSSTDDELERYGRQQASKTAGAKGALAGKAAGSAARQQGGSKLFAALQAAQAANNATQQGFEEEANAAKGIKMQKEQHKNDMAFNKAQAEYNAKTQAEEAEKQRSFEKKEAEKQREHEKKQTLWNVFSNMVTSWW